MTRTIVLDRSRPLRMLAVTLLAAATVFLLAGCDMGGAISGYSDDGGGGGGDTSDVEITSFAATGTIGVGSRGIVVGFSAPVASVSHNKNGVEVVADRQAIQDGISVTDADGNAVAVNSYVWSADGSRLTLYAPFKYCRKYTVTLGEAIQEVQIGVNPKDFDRGLACTADVPAIYDGVAEDMVMMTGEMISSNYSPAVLSLGDLLGILWKYEPGPGLRDASLLMNVDGEGHPAATIAVGDPDYELPIWGRYDRTDTDPATYLVVSNIPAECMFREPLRDTGDVNGDGVNDFMVAITCTENGSSRYYYLGLILGPYPTGAGVEAFAASRAEGYLGETGHTADDDTSYATLSRSAADFDGDGHFDIYGLWTDRTQPDDVTYDINVSEAEMFFGSDAVSSMLLSPDSRIVMSQEHRLYRDVDSGDVNGDGVSDMLLTDCFNGGTDETYCVDPIVYVHLGGQGMRDDMTDADASAMIHQSQEFPVIFPSVDAVGDVNADGYADMVVSYIYDFGPASNGVQYLMYGRESWNDSYVLELDYAAMFTGDSTYYIGRTAFPIGDVNNDGYDDLMLDGEIKSTGEQVYSIFLGGGLAGQLTLSDAHVTVIYSD